MGWASLIFWVGDRDIPVLKRYWVYLALVLVVGFQMFLSLRTYPYYFPYYNPLMGGGSTAPYMLNIGWGEGLDQAARYLNEKMAEEQKRPLSNLVRLIILEWLEYKNIVIPKSKK